MSAKCFRVAFSFALPYARRAVYIYTPLGSPDLEGARAALAECESAQS
jgi:hypothetical protein